jgi:hypothetical protein
MPTAKIDDRDTDRVRSVFGLDDDLATALRECVASVDDEVEQSGLKLVGIARHERDTITERIDDIDR